jgi:uroporphyrinogen-III synthase
MEGGEMPAGGTPGGYANTAGSTLEKVVEQTLVQKGFAVVSWARYRESPEAYGTELLVRNAPYQTIYGHSGKTEFVLHSSRWAIDARIECKWQQSDG